MKHKIVVVDDDPKTVHALKRLSERETFDFYGFDSPLQALEKMEDIGPQVVLTDQCMPEMEGVCFLEKVREKWPETIRMILTGFYIPDSTHGAICRGEIAKVMPKPWDDDTLLQEIRKAFHSFDAIQMAEGGQCQICGEKGSPEQIQMHDRFYMCGQCKYSYELHPGVIVNSLRRFLSGNVL